MLSEFRVNPGIWGQSRGSQSVPISLVPDSGAMFNAHAFGIPSLGIFKGKRGFVLNSSGALFKKQGISGAKGLERPGIPVRTFAQ